MEAPGELCNGILLWGADGSTDTPPFDDALSSNQKADLIWLLQQHPGVFSAQPGCTPLVTHIIPMPLRQIERARWRPIPFQASEVVNKEVQEMLCLNVIKPSKSPHPETKCVGEVLRGLWERKQNHHFQCIPHAPGGHPHWAARPSTVFVSPQSH